MRTWALTECRKEYLTGLVQILFPFLGEGLHEMVEVEDESALGMDLFVVDDLLTEDEEDLEESVVVRVVLEFQNDVEEGHDGVVRVGLVGLEVVDEVLVLLLFFFLDHELRNHQFSVGIQLSINVIEHVVDFPLGQTLLVSRGNDGLDFALKVRLGIEGELRKVPGCRIRKCRRLSPCFPTS
jgi:hypothetical protein